MKQGGVTLGSRSFLFEPQSFAAVLAFHHLSAPFAVFQVPVDGSCNSGIEIVSRRPAEFAADLRGIDGVASVMSWPGRTSTAYWSMAASIAATSAGVSGRVASIPVIRAANRGCNCWRGSICIRQDEHGGPCRETPFLQGGRAQTAAPPRRSRVRPSASARCRRREPGPGKPG